MCVGSLVVWSCVIMRAFLLCKTGYSGDSPVIPVMSKICVELVTSSSLCSLSLSLSLSLLYNKVKSMLACMCRGNGVTGRKYMFMRLHSILLVSYFVPLIISVSISTHLFPSLLSSSD